MGALLNFVLLSGGMDSATALASLVVRGEHCEALFVGYGQPSERDELVAARNLALAYGVPLREMSLSAGPFQDGEIQGRNALLIHLALLTVRVGPALIVIGIHAGTGYRDCSPEFVELMQLSLNFHSDGEIGLLAPFVSWNKADVFAQAQALKVPLTLTYSCERGGDPCGKCLSCLDRQGLYAIAK